MEKRTALIVGSTGLVGRFCLSYLLMDAQYEKVIAVLRKELPLKDPKLEQVVVDFDRLDHYKERLTADDIFCCLGTTIKAAGSKENFRKVDQYYPIELAKITSQNKAKQFLIISALGADKNSSIFYNRVKGEMQEALKKIPFQSTHVFQPSLLTGLRKEFRAGERIAQVLMHIFSPLMIGPARKYKPVDAMVVAHAMHIQAKENKSGIFIYPSDEIQKIFETRKA